MAAPISQKTSPNHQILKIFSALSQPIKYTISPNYEEWEAKSNGMLGDDKQVVGEEIESLVKVLMIGFKISKTVKMGFEYYLNVTDFLKKAFNFKN